MAASTEAAGAAQVQGLAKRWDVWFGIEHPKILMKRNGVPPFQYLWTQWLKNTYLKIWNICAQGPLYVQLHFVWLHVAADTAIRWICRSSLWKWTSHPFHPKVSPAIQGSSRLLTSHVQRLLLSRWRQRRSIVGWKSRSRLYRFRWKATVLQPKDTKSRGRPAILQRPTFVGSRHVVIAHGAAVSRWSLLHLSTHRRVHNYQFNHIVNHQE